MKKITVYLSIIIFCAFFRPAFAMATEPEIINRVITDKKIIALTFDADMTAKMVRDLNSKKVKSYYNEKIIKILNEQKVPATLFLVGMWVEQYKNVTQELSKNPLFEIGNHSYSHRGFSRGCYTLGLIPDSADREEITKTDNLLSKYATTHTKYFRFPGLCSDKSDVNIIKGFGYKIIGGTVLGPDVKVINPQKIIQTVISRIRPGGIIVMHLHGGKNAPATAEALPGIIKALKDEGYKFVKISELLATGTPAK